MADFAPPVGEPPAVQFITIGKLKVDAAYQRSLEGPASRRLVAAIAECWDWRLCVPLLVAARGQELFIIDGQHRWAAARLRGDIPFLPCAVGQYAGAADEAALFVAANRHRVAVNRLDLFRAALAAGDEATETIDNLLACAGLSIADTMVAQGLKPGQVTTTAVLYRALKEKGAERLGHAIAVLGKAFGGQVITYSGVIILALVGIDPAQLGEVGRRRLVDVLATRSADEWALCPELASLRGGLVRARTLARVITAALLEASVASARPASPPAPTERKRAPVVASVSGPAGDGRAWCDQCEQRVSPAMASACASTFCKAKIATAA